jgi:HTH-type transcriptional regulator, competence development regulator
VNKFGKRLRELRKNKELTLRALAGSAGVDFTYLSKIENGKAGYLPGAETIRTLASLLDADPLDLLRLADKVPPELQSLSEDATARRFFQRATEIASPEDWDALLNLLESRQQRRDKEDKE